MTHPLYVVSNLVFCDRKPLLQNKDFRKIEVTRKEKKTPVSHPLVSILQCRTKSICGKRILGLWTGQNENLKPLESYNIRQQQEVGYRLSSFLDPNSITYLRRISLNDNRYGIVDSAILSISIS